jgi:hypothetical protein
MMSVLWLTRSLSGLARTGRVGLTGRQLFKTDAFLEAQPFGNVPAAFGPDGTFQSLRVSIRRGRKVPAVPPFSAC